VFDIQTSVGNLITSLSHILSKNEKVEYHIKMKTHKLNCLISSCIKSLSTEIRQVQEYYLWWNYKSWNTDAWFRVTFIIAASCLLAGSVRNAYHTKYRDLMGERAPSCQTLRKGVFAAGAAFIVMTGITSELYYVSFSKANTNGPPPYARDAGVRMGNL